MKVFINEIYKVFIKRKLIILLIAVLIIECAITFSSLNKSTVMDEDSLIVYNQYIDEYGGELTDEKREKIENIIETTRRSETLKSEKRSEYLKGNITLEEYKVSLKKIQEDTKGEEGFFRFVDAYYHAVNSNISLADSHIWDVLFGYGSIDFLLVIFVIMMVISLTVYDDETGTNKLKFTLKKGKSTLISAQIITAILISFVLPAFVFAGRLVIARVFFNGVIYLVNENSADKICNIKADCWTVADGKIYYYNTDESKVGCVSKGIDTQLVVKPYDTALKK